MDDVIFERSLIVGEVQTTTLITLYYLMFAVVEQLRNEDEKTFSDDEVPMDWAAADNTGLMGELQQCRLNLQLNPTCSPSIDFPQNVFDNR